MKRTRSCQSAAPLNLFVMSAVVGLTQPLINGAPITSFGGQTEERTLPKIFDQYMNPAILEWDEKLPTIRLELLRGNDVEINTSE